MEDWKSLIDQQIRKAIGDGNVGSLPGSGKPLNLEEDPNTPPHLRMAHKILRDNDIAPEWAMLGRELDQRRERLLNNVRRAIRAYRGVLADADRLARQDGEIELAVTQCRRADVAWELAQQRFREATTHYNRKLLDYNLKLPPGMAQRTPLDLEREVVRLLQNP